MVITFFVMTTILAVILSVSVVLYAEIKAIRNMGNSAVSFYAADSGIEKVLFYDRSVKQPGAERGFCSMLSYGNQDEYHFAECPRTSDVEGLDSSLYCDYSGEVVNVRPLDTEGRGCDNDKCNNCELSFTTQLSNGSTSEVEASITPNETEGSDLAIKSTGIFNGVKRAIAIKSNKKSIKESIVISNSCVSPFSNEVGEGLAITTDVRVSTSDDTIKNVYAEIYKVRNADGTIILNPTAIEIELFCISGPCFVEDPEDPTQIPDFSEGTFSAAWNAPETGIYDVYIKAVEQSGIFQITGPEPVQPCR